MRSLNARSLRHLLPSFVAWALLSLPAPRAAAAAIHVTATTSMVSDLVQQVGGDLVQVTGLMGPGVDPHLYKPTASDVIKLQKAEVIFYSGLVLEGKMSDLFAQMARSKKHVYAVTESLPRDQLLEPPAFGGHYDPHVWFDVTLWSQCADVVAEGLSNVRPDAREMFVKRAAEARSRFATLDRWVRQKVSELPETRRILVTSHDAYNYFGRAYGFQVVGLQGISTVTQAGLADMAKMVDFIKQNQVKAIFVESSVSPAAIERISRDAGVRVGGEIFSDAMGTPGQLENGYDLGTYDGMIRHNVTTVIDALK